MIKSNMIQMKELLNIHLIEISLITGLIICQLCNINFFYRCEISIKRVYYRGFQGFYMLFVTLIIVKCNT